MTFVMSSFSPIRDHWVQRNFAAGACRFLKNDIRLDLIAVLIFGIALIGTGYFFKRKKENRN
jgi:LPXTG-motif cell wall-anchored protein